MTKEEKILAIATAVALLMKFYSVPFGGPLLLIVLSSLAFYYMFFTPCIFTGVGVKQRFQSGVFADQSRSVMLLATVIGYVLAILSYGALFLLQHWAGGTVFLAVGTGACFVLLVAITLMQLYDEEPAYRGMTWRLLVFLILGLGILFSI